MFTFLAGLSIGFLAASNIQIEVVISEEFAQRTAHFLDNLCNPFAK